MNVKIFAASSFLLGMVIVVSSADMRLPGNNVGYEPVQPIAFSHRVHAGTLALDCMYCHYGARSSRCAGVPSASICMNCHTLVTSSRDAKLLEKDLAEAEGREPRPIVSEELQKLYDALALDAEMTPISGKEPTPIEWVRVHNLPDFVYFDHRPHVARNIACQTCHGPVQSMERMRQDTPLSMGWCIECHRANVPSPSGKVLEPGERLEDHVSTNCVTCHL